MTIRWKYTRIAMVTPPSPTTIVPFVLGGVHQGKVWTSATCGVRSIGMVCSDTNRAHLAPSYQQGVAPKCFTARELMSREVCYLLLKLGRLVHHWKLGGSGSARMLSRREGFVALFSQPWQYYRC